MKLLKKTFSALLVLIMLLGVLPPGLIPTVGAFNSYSDVSGHWAAGSINRWNQLGFLDKEAFPGPEFLPNSFITRIEFFSLIVRALGATARADASAFSDLGDMSDSLYDIVAIAINMGIANGYPDGTMRPRGNLLRQDAATLAARAMGMSTVADWNLSRFSDAAFISPYARTYVASFVEKGLLSGYPDGSFRPSAFLTRAEAVRMLDNLFTNVFMPETGFRNVYLQGSLLIQTPGAEMRDSVIDGDVIIGDGVGNGNVVIANSKINGRLIVRGGGPNSVTLSGTEVTEGIFVASFGANTRIAVTDNSTVPVLESVSGFTLSGSGVASLTILENARRNAVVELNGVSLDDLNINGPGALVRMNSGHAINARFDEAGQGASLNLSPGTSLGYLSISAPNAAVSGTGSIRNLVISNSGATVAQTPDFLTLALNINASVGGVPVSNAASQWSNNSIDRLGSAVLRVQLLSGSMATFDQSVLSLNMVAGGTAAEVRVTQAAASRIPYTTLPASSGYNTARGAYWVGFFIPAPLDASNTVAVTYTNIVGAPIALPPKPLDTHGGVRGVIVYLPVFVTPITNPGTAAVSETGNIKEMLYINWGAHLTENIQFMNQSMHLDPLTASQRNTLQANFDNRILQCIRPGESYSGAEAIWRILNSDNPLGLPNVGNMGLNALNRAVSAAELRGILEDNQFAKDLTIDTSGNSQYSRLSDAGKLWVAEQVLAGRRTAYATPSAVKAAFDRAVQSRLSAETALLSLINNSADYAVLRRIIETAANAAILLFQTGSEPYRSYTPAQKDAMAEYLWRLRQYRSIQEVIDAIQKYLGDPANIPRPPTPDESQIISITARPSSAPANFAVGSPPFITVLEVVTDKGTMAPADVAKMTLEIRWRNNPANPIAEFVRSTTDASLTIAPIRQGSDVLEVRHPASGKMTTISVTVRAPIVVTGQLSFTQRDIVMRVGEVLNLWDPQFLTVIPQNATTLSWSSTDRTIVDIDSNGVIRARQASNTPVSITVRATNNDANWASVNVWVHDGSTDNAIFVNPERLPLQAGSSSRPGQVRVISPVPITAPLALRWVSLNPDIATVDIATGIITANVNPPPPPADQPYPEARISVRLINTNTPTVTLAEAFVTVIVRDQIDFNVVVARSVVENRGRGGEPYPSNFLQIQPLSTDYDLPETFIWESSNPVVLFTVDGGRTAQQRVETLPNQVPQIMTDGIGRSTITVRANSVLGPEVADPRFIVSAPRGVSGMEFYREQDPLPMSDTDAYGRMIEMINGQSIRVRAIEPGQAGRNLTWTMFLTDSQRSTDRPLSADRLLTYNNGTNMLRATSMGLARVVVTPTVANLPDGWGMTAEDLRGRWFGRSGEDLPFFVASPTSLTGYVFNELIDNQLSGLRLKDSGGNWLQWDNLDYSAVMSGSQVICDVNGIALTRANTANPSDVWLVVKTADTAGSNDLWVWIKPEPPRFTVFQPITQLTYSQYMNMREREANGIAIGYTIIGDFTYQTLLSDDITTLMPNELRVTAWTEVNMINRERAGSDALVTSRFVRTWGQMPTIDPGIIPTDGFDLHITVEILYTTNRGFANRIVTGHEGDPEEFPIGSTHANNPGTRTIRIIPDPPPELVTITMMQGDSGSITALEEFRLAIATAQQNIDILSAFRVTSGNADVLYIDNVGLNLSPKNYTAMAPGTVSLIVTQGINTVYINVVIEPAQVPVGTSVGPLPERPIIQNIAMVAGITQANLNTATFASANPAVLSIDPGPDPFNPEYRAVGVSPGNTDIIITTTTGPSLIARVRIQVVPGTATINPLMVGVSEQTRTLPGIMAAATAAQIDPATAVIESFDTTVLTIDNNGTATPRRPGRVGLYIRSRDGSKSTTVTVEVLRPPPTIILRASAGVAVGKTTRLEPFVTPFDADRSAFVWSSSDASVATVSDGIVTGVKAGIATITLTDKSNNRSAVCKVTVAVDTRPVRSISMSRRTLSLNVGSTSTLTVTYTPSNATIKGVTWTSDNSRVARVEPSGRVVAVSGGTAVITAISDCGARVATCTVTVKIPVTSVTLAENRITLKVGETYQLSPTVAPSNASSTQASFSTKAQSIASVSSAGLITARRAGSTTITVTVDGKSTTCQVTVVR